MKSKSTFNYHVSLLFVLLVIFSIGCKKADKVKTKTELLTAKPWKVTAITVSPGIVFNGATITDYYSSSFYPSCSKDDITTFSTNKTYVTDEGATKCQTSDPQTTTGPWAFNSDETILTLDNKTSFKILQLDETTLQGTTTEVANNINYTETFTFTRQ